MQILARGHDQFLETLETPLDPPLAVTDVVTCELPPHTLYKPSGRDRGGDGGEWHGAI